MDASGVAILGVELRAAGFRVRALRGSPPPAEDVRAMVATAQGTGFPDALAEALVTAAVAHDADGRPAEALAALRELVGVEGAEVGLTYARGLPVAVRVAVACDDAPLARRLVDALPEGLPANDLARATARAALLEHEGRRAAAADAYRAAAAGFAAFGNVVEAAYARLGEGRCLDALGDPRAPAVLHGAEADLRRLGFARA